MLSRACLPVFCQLSAVPLISTCNPPLPMMSLYQQLRLPLRAPAIAVWCSVSLQVNVLRTVRTTLMDGPGWLVLYDHTSAKKADLSRKMRGHVIINTLRCIGSTTAHGHIHIHVNSSHRSKTIASVLCLVLRPFCAS